METAHEQARSQVAEAETALASVQANVEAAEVALLKAQRRERVEELLGVASTEALQAKIGPQAEKLLEARRALDEAAAEIDAAYREAAEASGKLRELGEDIADPGPHHLIAPVIRAALEEPLRATAVKAKLTGGMINPGILALLAPDGRTVRELRGVLQDRPHILNDLLEAPALAASGQQDVHGDLLAALDARSAHDFWAEIDERQKARAEAEAAKSREAHERWIAANPPDRHVPDEEPPMLHASDAERERIAAGGWW